ncbi:MAG: hypothetical protein KGJ34_01695 [Patescibacteria group bacterium]|nr:hypothetical protein [Patescibacteria group bacterium]
MRFQTLILIASIAAIGLIATYVPIYISPTTPTFSTSIDYLKAVGPVQAEDTVWQASQSDHPLVDGHMYMHEVGAYIFDTYGPTGVGYCRTYFDHGCYNGFMLQAHSLNLVNAALDACNKLDLYALGGCIHGAGHQALVLNNYDVPKALDMCSMFAHAYAAGTSTEGIITACSFGVFMENAEPGMMESMAQDALMGNMSMSGMNMGSSTPVPIAHQAWALKVGDMSFPCDSDLVASQYRAGCWRMQTVVLASTMSSAKIVGLCNALTDQLQKSSCFVGFADGSVSGPQMNVKNIFSACGSADSAYWKNTCLIDFVQRARLNGYDNTVPDEICPQVDAADRAACESTGLNSA